MRRLFLPAPLLLAACAGTVPDAPSLLPRAIETRGVAEPAVAAPVDAPDPALESQIAPRIAAFDAAAKAFAEARTGLATRIDRAKGAAEGSERWLDGQSAIGDLQQARTAVEGAMADLEALAIARASAGQPPYPALDRAIATAQAELDREMATETELKAILGA
ncbi:MAG: hypothetical protein V4537_05265 [Pseudomonadota bacterium]